MNNKCKDLFKDKGFIIGGIRCLYSKEASDLLQEGAVLVDIRKDYETNYRVFDVPEIIYLAEDDFKKNYGILPKERPLIIADAVGIVNKKAASFLIEHDFFSVAVLSGGIIEWMNSGLPVKVDKDYELIGQCSCKLRPRKKKNKK